MATGVDWKGMLQDNGWIDDENKIVAPGEALVKILLPEGRSFTIRGGKASPPIHLKGEFLIVQENNVDTAGRSRVTAIPLGSILGIESLA